MIGRTWAEWEESLSAMGYEVYHEVQALFIAENPLKRIESLA